LDAPSARPRPLSTWLALSLERGEAWLNLQCIVFSALIHAFGERPSLPFDAPQRFLHCSPAHHFPSLLLTQLFRLFCRPFVTPPSQHRSSPVNRTRLSRHCPADVLHTPVRERGTLSVHTATYHHPTPSLPPFQTNITRHCTPTQSAPIDSSYSSHPLS
jgi:hypothetical protein